MYLLKYCLKSGWICAISSYTSEEQKLEEPGFGYLVTDSYVSRKEYYIREGKLAKLPPLPDADPGYCFWNGKNWDVVMDKKTEARKTKDKREREFPFLGSYFQIDKVSLEEMLLTYSSMDTQDSVEWRDTNNNWVTLAKEELGRLFREGTAERQKLMKNYWDIRDEVARSRQQEG